MLGICIVIVLLVIFYVGSTWNVTTNEDYLYGYWIAEDDAFCDDSDISSMLVFIGKPVNDSWFGRTQTRTCYVIIMNDILNCGFTLSYIKGWSGMSIGKYSINAEVEFDDGGDYWPKDVVVETNMIDGTLKIYSGDVVYARLHKQHDVSNSCKLLDELEEK